MVVWGCLGLFRRWFSIASIQHIHFSYITFLDFSPSQCFFSRNIGTFCTLLRTMPGSSLLFWGDLAAFLCRCCVMMSLCRYAFCVLRFEDILQNEGPRALFRGLESTLWRDVPFSAFYWLGVEVVREKFLEHGISVVKKLL